MAKKRYDEGGVSEGENANIGDDTRARALKWVQEQADKGSEDEGSGEKTVSRATKASVSSKPASGRGASVDDEAGRSRGRPAEGEPISRNGNGRTRTREELIAAIPTGGKPGAGATPGNGNSIDDTDTSRNLKNIASALTPMGGGVGKIGAELALAGRAAKTAEAAAAAAKATRAARVAKVAPRAAREAKTLNPNAWMAGPKGMKENFKKGGAVGSASRRADGIATRGKTNCKMR